MGTSLHVDGHEARAAGSSEQQEPPCWRDSGQAASVLSLSNSDIVTCVLNHQPETAMSRQPGPASEASCFPSFCVSDKPVKSRMGVMTWRNARVLCVVLHFTKRLVGCTCAARVLKGSGTLGGRSPSPIV